MATWRLGIAASCALLGALPAAAGAADSGRCQAPERAAASRQAPPEWLLRELAVLRRAPTADDRLPRTARRFPPLQSVDLRFVRALPAVEGETSRSFLVPGVDREPRALTPRRCLARLPRRAARRARARDRRVRRRQYLLCLVDVEGRLVGATCLPARGSGVFSPANVSGDYQGDVRRLQGVVPDRVATVEVALDDGSVRTVTPVANRWVVLSQTGFPPHQVRWLDADGREIARHAFD
jgi:hypothetical protein